MEDSSLAIRSVNRVISALSPQLPVSKSHYQKLIAQSRQIPRTSEARLQQSISDTPITDINSLRNDLVKKEQTYLYLGYGSNMCALTFLERRGIRPLSQVNVTVPEISLTFDLAGVPYSEPCFGNVRFRTPDELPFPPQEPTTPHPPINAQDDYHKNRWHKGLVGIAYEVTASDFAHIIATEGGGASYKDVLVTCYPLPSNPHLPVPKTPTLSPFKAHTLYSPSTRNGRPDPSYAQPSARYMKLLTDGAMEHDLPHEYRCYLANIRPYHVTTTAQQLGQFVFLSMWGPIFAFLFSAETMFTKPDGTFPAWFARMVVAIHVACWASYDRFFEPLFGDGERSIPDGGREPEEEEKEREVGLEWGKKGGEDMGSVSESVSEKTPLMMGVRGKVGSRKGVEVTSGDQMV